jgi:hypothetical protein
MNKQFPRYCIISLCTYEADRSIWTLGGLTVAWWLKRCVQCPDIYIKPCQYIVHRCRVTTHGGNLTNWSTSIFMDSQSLRTWHWWKEIVSIMAWKTPNPECQSDQDNLIQYSKSNKKYELSPRHDPVENRVGSRRVVSDRWKTVNKPVDVQIGVGSVATGRIASY